MRRLSGQRGGESSKSSRDFNTRDECFIEIRRRRALSTLIVLGGASKSVVVRIVRTAGDSDLVAISLDTVRPNSCVRWIRQREHHMVKFVVIPEVEHVWARKGLTALGVNVGVTRELDHCPYNVGPKFVFR